MRAHVLALAASFLAACSSPEPAPHPLLVDPEPEQGGFAQRSVDDRVVATIDTHDHYAHTAVVDPAKFVYFARKADRKVVALTFDCAWVPEAAGLDVLDGLARHGVKSTFFVAGPFVCKDPFARGFDPRTAPLAEQNIRLVRRIVEDGHEIGNHSLTHPHDSAAVGWGGELTAMEIGWSRLVARAFPEGAPPNAAMTRMWRAPYGEYGERSLDAAAKVGFTAHVGWNTHTMDAIGLPTCDAPPKPGCLAPAAMTRNVTAFASKNEGLDAYVVLAHLGAPYRWGSDKDGLDALVKHAAASGRTFARVGEILRSSP